MTVQILTYHKARSLIKSGDILLCSGNGAYSRLIRWASKSEWSHVAFVLRHDSINRIMVMESVESIGVRTVPLSSYLSNYSGSGKPYNGRLMIARHKNWESADIKHLSRHAVDLLGNNYSWSEVAKIAARIVFKNANTCTIKKDKKEYICSEYVNECYKSVGLHVGHSCGYITPADFSNEKNISPVCLLS